MTAYDNIIYVYGAYTSKNIHSICKSSIHYLSTNLIQNFCFADAAKVMSSRFSAFQFQKPEF